MIEASLVGIVFLLILVLILIIIIGFLIVKIEIPCPPIERNFEMEFLEKVKDPVFLAELNENPKEVLEREISAFTGQPFILPDSVNVKIIQEEPNDLHLMIPSQQPLPLNGPLQDILNVLNENITFGLFMGNYRQLWWRFGIHAGSCIADINEEVKTVKNRRCLICS